MVVERLPASLHALTPGFRGPQRQRLRRTATEKQFHTVFVVFVCCGMIFKSAFQGIVSLVRRKYDLAQMFSWSDSRVFNISSIFIFSVAK